MTNNVVTDDRKKLAEKVRALFAKANSTEHEAEREAFEAKALELMARHDLAERELADADRTVGRVEIDLAQWGNAKSGVALLYQWVGELFGCFVFSWTDGNRGKSAILYGTDAQVERTEMLVGHLLTQLRSDISAARPRSRKSFATSWAWTVSERLKAAQAVVYSRSNALVPTTIEAEKEAMRSGIRVRTSSARLTSAFDMAAGASAGSAADLGQSRLDGAAV